MNILLVDSDPTTRAVLRDALEAAGYLVRAAGDLGKAVDRLSEMRPDLLITRPYINSMSGWMAAEYLRTRRHGLPVLIVGGFLEDDRNQTRSAIEEIHTYPKAFTRDELLAAVKEVFATVPKKTHHGKPADSTRTPPETHD
jgi:DNA-binding response OmpR family regulator